MVKRRKSEHLNDIRSILPDHSFVTAKLTTNSVMSPILVMMSIAITTLVAGAVLMDGPQREILVWLVVVIVVFVMAIFSLFAYFAPDRLQSEEYLVAQQQIKLMRENGKDPATLDLKANMTANPDVQEVIMGEGIK